MKPYLEIQKDKKWLTLDWPHPYVFIYFKHSTANRENMYFLEQFLHFAISGQ